ncbi:MAG: hypothetical protein RL335_742, partial [Bacteroidota bacterium]
VKRRLGKIDETYVKQGPKLYNPITTTIIRVSTRTVNIEVKRDAERRIIEAEGKKEIARIQAEGEKNAAIIQAEAKKQMMEIEAEGRANAMKIEADATRRANDTINKTLTPAVLKLRQIEAFRHLSNSNNSKLIITDGKAPFLSVPDKF